MIDKYLARCVAHHRDRNFLALFKLSYVSNQHVTVRCCERGIAKGAVAATVAISDHISFLLHKLRSFCQVDGFQILLLRVFQSFFSAAGAIYITDRHA